MAPRLTARERALRGVTEAQWQEQVFETMQRTGWVYFHVVPPRGVDHRRLVTCSGFPDIIAAHPRTGDVIALELKDETNQATPEQLQWLAWLEANGVGVLGVIRPRDVDRLNERLNQARDPAQRRHDRLHALARELFENQTDDVAGALLHEECVNLADRMLRWAERGELSGGN